LPVLINGDDILFRCDDSFYSEWLKAISEVGFKLSLGKNYVHKSFLTVNSTGFLYSNGQITDVPFLNCGLLTGQSKIGGSRRETELAPIWSYYNDVIHSAIDPVRAHHRFMHYNASNIAELTCNGQYSLFTSPHYGGLGFDLLPEVREISYFTSFQRRFGNFLRSKFLEPYDGELDPTTPFRGLVALEKTKVQQKHVYHYGHFKQAAIGPLNEDERVAIDPSRALGQLMSSPIMPPEVKGLIIRPPKRSVLRSFRAVVPRPSAKHVDVLLTCPYRVIEYGLTLCK